MIIRINDDDGNALEEYRFDPRKFISPEAIAAEKVTGLFWSHLMIGLHNGSAQAVTAVVWLLRKRNDPKLKYTDVVVNVGMTEVVDPDLDERYAEAETAVEDSADTDTETDDTDTPVENPAAPKAGDGGSSSTPT